MRELMDMLKGTWLAMLEPPWRNSVAGLTPFQHQAVWLIGWAWAIAGLILGAFFAPSLVQYVGLANTPYRDELDIGIAVLAGFLVQLLGWLLLLPFVLAVQRINYRALANPRLLLSVLAIIASVPVPLAAVGYALYRYFTWVGTGQGLVTTGFVGGLLIKTFLIPFIKSIVTGVAFQRFMTWLHGKDASTSKP
jgi:hypothetical protein